VPLLFFGWKWYHYHSGFNHWAMFFVTLMPLLIIGFVATPYKYILTGTHLVIKRYLRDVEIPLSDIQSIQLIPDNEKKTIWRSFGYAGPFGYFGCFTSAKFAKLTVFARRYDNWTLIVTDRKKYVIAPDDLQLIDVAAQQIGQTEADLQTFDVQENQWRKRLPAAIIIGTLVILFISSIGAIRDTVVEINNETLVIKGSYGLSIPLPEIEHVDTVTHLSISRRVNGYGFAGTLKGYCKLSDGTRVKVFLKTKHKPYILIHSKNIKEPIYLNFRDREKTINLYYHLKNIQNQSL